MGHFFSLALEFYKFRKCIYNCNGGSVIFFAPYSCFWILELS